MYLYLWTEYSTLHVKASTYPMTSCADIFFLCCYFILCCHLLTKQRYWLTQVLQYLYWGVYHIFLSLSDKHLLKWQEDVYNKCCYTRNNILLADNTPRGKILIYSFYKKDMPVQCIVGCAFWMASFLSSFRASCVHVQKGIKAYLLSSVLLLLTEIKRFVQSPIQTFIGLIMQK